MCCILHNVCHNYASLCTLVLQFMHNKYIIIDRANNEGKSERKKGKKRQINERKDSISIKSIKDMREERERKREIEIEREIDREIDR